MSSQRTQNPGCPLVLSGGRQRSDSCLRRVAAVLVGDAHLCRQTWTNEPEVCGDGYYSFWQAVRLAVDCQADLIILGDWFDHPKPDSLTLSITSLLVNYFRVLNPDRKIYFIQGQHDRTDFPWGQLLGAYHAHDLSWSSGSVCFYARDFSYDPILYWEKAPPADIWLGHQTWKETAVWAAPSLKQLSARCYWFVCGDFHRPVTQIITSYNDRSFAFLSTGSTHLCSADEPLDKFVYLVYDKNADETVPEIRAVRLATRIFICDDDLDLNLLDRLPERLKQAQERDHAPVQVWAPIWLFRPYQPVDHTILRRLQLEASRYGVTVIVKPRKPVKQGEINLLTTSTFSYDSLKSLRDIVGECVGILTGGQDNELYKVCISIALSNDPVGQAERWVKDMNQTIQSMCSRASSPLSRMRKPGHEDSESRPV